ncbi:unnamed protein product [Cochlearia groenlandica]
MTNCYINFMRRGSRSGQYSRSSRFDPDREPQQQQPPSPPPVQPPYPQQTAIPEDGVAPPNLPPPPHQAPVMMRIAHLLRQPGHANLPVLDPRIAPNTFS